MVSTASTVKPSSGVLCESHKEHCARQYQDEGPFTITDRIGVSFDLIRRFLSDVPSRTLDLSLENERPTLVYTDASEEGSTWRIGAMIDSPRAATLRWTSALVTDSVVQKLSCKQKYITHLEAMAVIVAWDTWEQLLWRAPVLLFGDNDAATACLIKGYSPKGDLCRISGDFWMRVVRNKNAVWIDRVESSSNSSDGPSREDDSLMVKLGAEYMEPETRYFDHRVDDDPRRWFAE